MASSISVCVAAFTLLLISSSLISGSGPPPSPSSSSLGEGVVDTKTQPSLHSSLKDWEGNMKGENEDWVGNMDEDVVYDGDKDDIKSR
nr:uncharacterized protein DDB_G0290685-like [Ipomoea trifida]